MKVGSQAVALALRSLRLAAKMTSVELARAVGLSPSALSRLESGKRSLEFVEAAAIVAVLGTDLQRILELAQRFEREGYPDKVEHLRGQLEELRRSAVGTLARPEAG
jgi:transcriptional regulator with XRE-family HTH domain